MQQALLAFSYLWLLYVRPHGFVKATCEPIAVCHSATPWAAWLRIASY